MIFSAGFGTRMGRRTKNIPKPLVQVAGKPLIDYAIETLREADVPRIVANTHYRFQQLEKHLERRDIIISREEPDILETGGGLKAALAKIAADVVITHNADIIWFGPNPIKALLSAWHPDLMDALLLCVPLKRALGRTINGDFTIRSDNTVERGGSNVYTGAQIIKTNEIELETEPVFSLNKVWNRLADNGRLHATSYEGIWCDVGHEKGITLAESRLRKIDV